MAYTNPTRKVSEVFRAVKRQFGDESGVQLEDPDLIAWINDAQNEIVATNKMLKSRSTIPAVPGQVRYGFPSDNVYQIESVHFGGKKIPNLPFSQAEESIFGQDPKQEAKGFPQFWYEWAGEFTFWPVPDTNKDITLFYSKTAEPVHIETDVLSVPDSYYQDVVRYVLQQAYEMDEDWQASQTKAQQFVTSVSEQGERERTAQHMTFQVITLVD